MALTDARKLNVKGKNKAAVLVGTYLATRDAIFVNARLLRPSDGAVLSTAEMALPNTPQLANLAGVSRGNSGGAVISTQSAPILPPTYPSLGGSVIQSGTAGIPIVQGR